MSLRFMSRPRLRAFAAALGALATVGVLLVPAGAGATQALPTLNIALTGAKGISVSGSEVSGAVQIVSTFSGKVPPGPENAPGYALVRLNPGVSVMQAFQAVQSHGGDINALTPYGALLVDAGAPSTVQTVLTPGNWVALNVSGSGAPAFQTFTVTQAGSPASLPTASATEAAIEFGFRGPRVLHNGTIVRAENHGWLVHMVTLNGVKSRAAGIRLMRVLKVSTSFDAAKPFLNGAFVTLLGPASNGAMQQMVLHTKPGWYVEACFMDTQDGRQHVQIGMERLVRVVR